MAVLDQQKEFLPEFFSNTLRLTGEFFASLLGHGDAAQATINAVLGACLAGLTCGVLGSFITLRTGDATVSKWGKEKLDANAEMWGERDRAPGLEREKDFWAPSAVTVDDDNAIYVCDGPRNRIQVYRKQSPTFAGPRL